MKRSLTFVCILASGFGVNALAQASSSAASSPAAMPSAPVPASATAPAGPAKIAIIQFQQAVAATNEGQRDFTELRKKFEPKQTALKTQSDDIDSLKKQLQTQSATMSETARASLTRSIDEKTKSLQRSAEDAQNDYQTEAGEAFQKIAEKVFQVAQAYAAQSGYTVLLDASAQQSPVLWTAPGTDISQAVVAAYNQKSGVPAQPNSTSTTTPRSTTAPTRSPTAPARTTTPSTTPR